MKVEFIEANGEPWLIAVECKSNACSHCVFSRDKECGASDLMDAGLLPVCDEDGIGFNCFYLKHVPGSNGERR